MLSWQTRRVCSACSVGRRRRKHGGKKLDWTHEWKHNKKEVDQRMSRRQIDDFFIQHHFLKNNHNWMRGQQTTLVDK